jgi:hypothetical protein
LTVDVDLEEAYIQAPQQHREDTGKEAQAYMGGVEGSERLAGSPRSAGSWEEEWENQENQRFGGGLKTFFCRPSACFRKDKHTMPLFVFRQHWDFSVFLSLVLCQISGKA